MCKGKKERFDIVETTLTSPKGCNLHRQMVDAGHSIFLLIHDGNDKYLFLQQRVPFEKGLQYNVPTVSFAPKTETLFEAADRLSDHKCGVGICMVTEICTPFQMAPTFMNCICHVVSAQLAIYTEKKPLDSKAIEKLEWINRKEVKSLLTNHLQTGTFKEGLPLDGRAQHALLIAKEQGIF